VPEVESRHQGLTEHCHTRTDQDSQVCHKPRRALAAIRCPTAEGGRGRTDAMSRRHRERGHGRPHRSDATHGGLPRHAPAPPLQSSPPPIQPGAAIERPPGELERPEGGLERPTTPMPASAPIPTPDPIAVAAMQPPAQGELPATGVAQRIVATGAAVPPIAPAQSVEGAAAMVEVPTAAWAGEQVGPNGRTNGGSCTPAQLRRFIKSRAWVPMHELRRRFAINGSEDEMTLVEVDGSQLFIGLPDREGRILGDFLRGGEVGFELSHDPASPVVVGVYPMRPVPRP
jgi:hypothetical protein